jgi:hypothetical protein
MYHTPWSSRCIPINRNNEIRIFNEPIEVCVNFAQAGAAFENERCVAAIEVLLKR